MLRGLSFDTSSSCDDADYELKLHQLSYERSASARWPEWTDQLWHAWMRQSSARRPLAGQWDHVDLLLSCSHCSTSSVTSVDYQRSVAAALQEERCSPVQARNARWTACRPRGSTPIRATGATLDLDDTVVRRVLLIANCGDENLPKSVVAAMDKWDE